MQFSAQETGTPNPFHPWKDTLMCVSSYGTTGTRTITKSPLKGKPSATKYEYPAKGAMNAFGVIVKHQSGDFDSTTTTSSGATSSTTSSTSTETSTGGGGSGLSSGASIGIGVSVGVLALALIVGGVYLAMRHRKKQNALAYQNAFAADYPEVQSAHISKVPQEIGESELPPQELDGNGVRQR